MKFFTKTSKTQNITDAPSPRKEMKIFFGIRAKLTIAVVLFLMGLLAFTIIIAMDREIDFATQTSDIRALENIQLLEKIFSEYFTDRLEFTIEKNKKYISEKLKNRHYISNHKNAKNITFKYIYDVKGYRKINRRKKRNFKFINFKYNSIYTKRNLYPSKKWEKEIKKFKTASEWERGSKSRYNILKSRIDDASENIKKGFFNFQFLKIYTRKATRYFPMPARLIWFQKKSFPYEYKLHNRISNITKKNIFSMQKYSYQYDIEEDQSNNFEFLYPGTNEKKDRMLLKPLFIDYKPPLKDVSTIIYKILAKNYKWMDFQIDGNIKKKFSFFYEDKIQEIIDDFLKHEQKFISRLIVIDNQLKQVEDKLKVKTVNSIEERLKRRRFIYLNTKNFFKDKEWYSLNKKFKKNLKKKNKNLKKFMSSLRKETNKSLTIPYNKKSGKIKKKLYKIKSEQRKLNEIIRKIEKDIRIIKWRLKKERKKSNMEDEEFEDIVKMKILPEKKKLNYHTQELEEFNQKQVKHEGNLNALKQNYRGKAQLPKLLAKVLLKSYYNFDYPLRLKEYEKSSIFPNEIQQQFRKRQMLSLRNRAALVLKNLYSGIITTSVVFTAEEKVIKERINWWLTFSAIIITIGFILSFIFSTLFVTEMKKIASKTKIVGRGSLDVSFDVNRSDELGLIAYELNGMVSGLKEKSVIKSAFGKIVDPRVRDHILKDGQQLGGETREATILFSDIRGFTTLSERLTPVEVVSLLNRFFEKMSVCIDSQEGIINKFIGDALLAVFGAPIKVQHHPEKAIEAAFLMRIANTQLNKRLKKEGLSEIKIGIGIHTGSVLAGNIGSTDRMEYTVIGDTVNVASRLEGLCKTYNEGLIISEKTLSLLPEVYQKKARFLDDVKVKGKVMSVKVYAL